MCRFRWDKFFSSSVFLELPTSAFLWESICNFEPGKLKRKEPQHQVLYCCWAFYNKTKQVRSGERKINIAVKTREIHMQSSTGFVLLLEYECALQLHEANALRF